LHLSFERNSPLIPTPRGGSPIVHPVFEAALAILEDCGKLSTLMVPRNSLPTIEDRDSVSAPGISCCQKGNQAGLWRFIGAQPLRQDGCRCSKYRQAKKLTAIQISSEDHILVLRIALDWQACAAAFQN
jgi:hypothetical protein